MKILRDEDMEITKEIDVRAFRSVIVDEPAAIGKLSQALDIVTQLDEEVSGMKDKFRAAMALIKDALRVMEKPDAR